MGHDAHVIKSRLDKPSIEVKQTYLSRLSVCKSGFDKSQGI